MVQAIQIVMKSKKQISSKRINNSKPGMTLLELVVTLSIVVIMTGFVIFSGRHVGAQSLVDTNANLIKSLINSAQDTAKSPPAGLDQRRYIVITFSYSNVNKYEIFASSGSSCDYQSGYTNIKAGNFPPSIGIIFSDKTTVSGDSNNILPGSKRCVIFDITDPTLATVDPGNASSFLTVFSKGSTTAANTPKAQINVSSNGLVTIN